MTTERLWLRHVFAGGEATDFGPTSDAVPNDAGVVSLPFLLNAENVIYEFDGGPHKVPGTSRLNSTALNSGAVIKGLFDYWDTGTGATSTQHRIVHSGTTIMRDNADGTFTNLFTGLASGAVPAYAVLEDVLVMANDALADVPRSWDGTTAQNLAGTPPNFSFCVEHHNRMFAAGDEANSSRLYYSGLLDAADWVGGGSGFIDISPRDGDRITGIISHRNELFVFKGPYKGSIHRITGSAPTGSDAFARRTFARGIGAVGHNTLFTFRDDVGFMWSDGTIHSLKATEVFQDYNRTALSWPIHTWIRGHVNFGRLKHAWAVDWPDFGFVLFGLPIDSSTDNNIVRMMDYRFEPVRWAQWPAFSTPGSLALVVDPADNDRRIVMEGGTDGFVRKYGQPNRAIDGLTSINFRATTPFLSYATPVAMKTIGGGSLGLQPKNDGNVVFGWTRDNNAQQTQNVSQGGADVLALAAANQFTLGTSQLGGARFVDRFFELEEGGEFRSVSLDVTNNVINEDVELHSISTIVERGAWSTEN